MFAVQEVFGSNQFVLAGLFMGPFQLRAPDLLPPPPPASPLLDAGYVDFNSFANKTHIQYLNFEFVT